MSRPSGVGFLWLFLAVLFWAGNALVGRAAPGEGIPPLALNFWRWVVAGAILAGMSAPRMRGARLVGLRAAVRSRWWVFGLYGLCLVAGFNTFLYIGLQYTTAVQAALIQSVLPILVVLFARVLLGQGIRPRQAVGVVLSLAGAALVVTRGSPGMFLSLRLNVGDVWILGAVSVWALQTIVVRWKPPEVDLISFQTVSIAAGLIPLLPFYLLEAAGGRTMPLTQASLLFVGYAAVFASVIAVSCWNAGTLLLGAHAAGFMGNLYPLLTSVLAVVVLGESFLWFHLVGGGLVLAGIYVASSRPR